MPRRKRRGWGEGSISWRTVTRKGRQYTYCRGILPAGADGRRREKLARDRKAIEKWLDDNAGRDDHRPAEPERIVTLGAYSIDWLRDAQPRIRASTLEFYRNSLKHVAPLSGIRIDALTPQHVRDLITDGVERGLANRTIRGIVQTLGYVLRQAEADGLVRRNVATLVRLPKNEPRREPRAFTAAQARRIVELGRGDPLGSLYAVALGTALRRGELLELTWADVDLRKASLRVDRSKTRAGIRWVPLSAYVVDVLRSLERSPGRIWAYHPSSVSHDFPDFCRRAGVPVLTLHELRHTALTLMAEEGVPIEVRRWLAGHSKTEQTAHYSHESERLMRDAVERLGKAVSA